METVRIDALPVSIELHSYILVRMLGSGAFGITYLAKHHHLGSSHVIKEYLPDCAMREHNRSTVSPKSVSDRDLFTWGLKSFFDEAKLLHQLSHPHVVKVTDLFEANGTAYFVMPYLRGITFHEWMGYYPNPRQDELEAIFVPLLEGLKYIHDKGLLHRDVKPENIYILENGHPILIDFGSARIAIGQKSKALTQVLTPHFAPHEQYRTKGTFTPALDLYGIAACMYQAITGKLPEEAPDRIEEDLQPKLAGSEYENRYAANFLRAIDKSLSVYARDRHQDGFAFQKDLVGQSNQPLDEPAVLPQQDHSKTDPVPIEAVEPPETDERLSGYKPVIHGDKASHDYKSVWIIAWIAMLIGAVWVSGHFWQISHDSKMDDHVQSTQPAPERRQAPPPVERRTETQITQGSETLPDGGKYVGGYKNGKFHGQGTYTYADGRKYIGEFKDNYFYGHGTFTHPDGGKYVGNFKDDRPHGQGTLTHPDIGKYIGGFKDGKFHGQGTWTHPEGDKYVGEFKDDNFHGQGTFTHADGRKYVGSFANDKRHGQGTLTHPDGSRYVGEWKDGLLNGQGTLTLPSGVKYVGGFKDGNYHGQGTWTHPEGDKYVGEFKDDNFHGQGTYTFPDGRKYIGEFKDDKFHGQGIEYNSDGSVYFSGQWRNDQPVR
jgi:serine/threonine protein kinase